MIFLSCVLNYTYGEDIYTWGFPHLGVFFRAGYIPGNNSSSTEKEKIVFQMKGPQDVVPERGLITFTHFIKCFSARYKSFFLVAVRLLPQPYGTQTLGSGVNLFSPCQHYSWCSPVAVGTQGTTAGKAEGGSQGGGRHCLSCSVICNFKWLLPQHSLEVCGSCHSARHFSSYPLSDRKSFFPPTVLVFVTFSNHLQQFLKWCSLNALNELVKLLC